LGNPNILSIFALTAYTFIFFKVNNSHKILYGLLTFGIILFTSSKTGLLIFLILSSVLFLLSRKKINIFIIFKFIAVLVGVLTLFLVLLYKYQENFPYMAQLLAFVESDSGDVSAIKS